MGPDRFTADAVLGSLAPNEVKQWLFQTFASLRMVGGAQPQTEILLGPANLVLDSTITPVGPVALYAYTDSSEGGSAWIGVAGPQGKALGAAVQIVRQVPAADESVTGSFGTWGGVVWGSVAARVVHAELRTVEGATIPATLLPLPPLPYDLQVEGQQLVWGVVDEPTGDRVTTLLYDERGNILNTFYPTGPRVTITTGTDPVGGPWELYLEVTSEGTGLGFRFEAGGGGSGCCLRPLEGDLRLDGSGSSGAEPGHITALASARVTRVVFEASSGQLIEGRLFGIPDESLGIPNVALVIVPAGTSPEGELVAYDGEGTELGREVVGGAIGEPPGPSAEIDAAWTLLRDARDTIQL